MIKMQCLLDRQQSINKFKNNVIYNFKTTKLDSYNQYFIVAIFNIKRRNIHQNICYKFKHLQVYLVGLFILLIKYSESTVRPTIKVIVLLHSAY